MATTLTPITANYVIRPLNTELFLVEPWEETPMSNYLYDDIGLADCVAREALAGLAAAWKDDNGKNRRFMRDSIDEVIERLMRARDLITKGVMVEDCRDWAEAAMHAGATDVALSHLTAYVNATKEPRDPEFAAALNALRTPKE